MRRAGTARFKGHDLVVIDEGLANTVLIHHTALGVVFNASSFEELAALLENDYETEVVLLDILDDDGVEKDAPVLVIWPGFDDYSAVASTIRRREAERNS